jgi:hypothetical protein
MRKLQCGTISELAALRYYAEQGYSLFLPYDHDTQVDFIALKGTEMIRVQVKTASVYRNTRRGAYRCVQLNGYTPDDFDELFVLDPATQRQWRIPWKTIGLPASVLVLNRVDQDGLPCEYQNASKKRIETNQWRVDALDRTVHRQPDRPGAPADPGHGPGPDGP